MNPRRTKRIWRNRRARRATRITAPQPPHEPSTVDTAPDPSTLPAATPPHRSQLRLLKEWNWPCAVPATYTEALDLLAELAHEPPAPRRRRPATRVGAS